jgi:hypothetical protein
MSARADIQLPILANPSLPVCWIPILVEAGQHYDLLAVYLIEHAVGKAVEQRPARLARDNLKQERVGPQPAGRRPKGA